MATWHVSAKLVLCSRAGWFFILGTGKKRSASYLTGSEQSPPPAAIPTDLNCGRLVAIVRWVAGFAVRRPAGRRPNGLPNEILMTELQDLSDNEYDYDYRETVSLEDGTEVLLRLLRPGDRERLRRGFQQLSEESKYRRFLGPKSKLSDRELEYLVDIDQVDHIAIAAEPVDREEGPREAGLARCVRLHDEPEAAEAAVTVLDAFQGIGLGRTLLDRLVEAARERGIEVFRATLFAQNRPMQSLLDEIGDAQVIEHDGPVVTLGIALERGEPEPGAAETEDERTPTALERVLSLTGRGAASLVDKFTSESDPSEVADVEPNGASDAAENDDSG